MEKIVHKIPRVQERPESPQEKARRVAALFADLSDVYGIDAMLELIKKLDTAATKGTRVKAEAVLETFQGKETRGDFQKRSRAQLEQLNIFSGGQFDLSLFLSKEFRSLAPRNNRTFAETRSDYLANVFDNEPIALTNLPENGVRPLLYAPKHQEDALDPKCIRQSTFHLGFWEVPNWLTNVNTRSPGAREEFRALDTAIAAVILHPKYGNGRRNAQGVLEVLGDDGKYQPFSGAWLRKQKGMGFKNPDRSDLALHRPLEFLQKYAPSLFESGILQRRDFAAQKTAHVDETARITHKGQYRLNSIRYSLGNEWAKRKLRIDQITDDVAAIVELDDINVGTPVALFSTFDRTAPEVVVRKTGNSQMYDALNKDTDVRAYTAQNLVRGQDLNQRTATLQAKEYYEKILSLDNALKREGAPALRSLSPDLFAALSRSVLVAQHTRVVELAVKECGKPALEAAALLAKDKDFFLPTIRALTFLDAEQESVGNMVVDAIRERQQFLQDIENAQTSGTIDESTARQGRYEINSRFSAMLTVVSAAKHEEGEVIDHSALIEALAQQNQSLSLFAKTFRDAFKGGSAESLNDALESHVQERRPSAFSEEERKEMAEIVRRNWQSSPQETQAHILHDLQEQLEASDETTRFLEIKKDGIMLGFICISHDKDSRYSKGTQYLGLLNVNNPVHEFAIGEALLKKATMEARTHGPVHMSAELGGPVVNKYNQTLGGVIDRAEIFTDTSGNTSVWIHLLWNAQLDAHHNDTPVETTSINLQHPINAAQHIESMRQRGMIATHLLPDPNDPNKRTLTWIQDPAQE